MDIQNLQVLKDDAVPWFSLDGTQSWAKVLRVIDGDTVVCALPLFDSGKVYKFRIRLCRINAAEKNTGSEARLAMERLIALCGDGLIYVRCKKHDKYGRILADLYASDASDEPSFSDILLKEHLVKPF